MCDVKILQNNFDLIKVMIEWELKMGAYILIKLGSLNSVLRSFSSWYKDWNYTFKNKE